MLQIPSPKYRASRVEFRSSFNTCIELSRSSLSSLDEGYGGHPRSQRDKRDMGGPNQKSKASKSNKTTVIGKQEPNLANYELSKRL